MIVVDSCLFINRAPFKKNLEISFKEGINILCGINGRGKTTILSYIVDAFYEMARPNYPGSFEGIENKFYRVSSIYYKINPSAPSIVYIRFKIDEEIVDYAEVCGKLTEAEYNDLVNYEGKIEYRKINNGLELNDTVKVLSRGGTEAKTKEVFTNSVVTYFPSYRYELPGYLNNPYKNGIRISDAVRFSGELPNPIEVCTGLKEFSSWLLDLVLDWEVNKQTSTKQIKGRLYNVDVTPESEVWDNLSKMMKNVLLSKNCQGRVRFGIGRRSQSGNRISVIHEAPGLQEQICPNLSFLSSGETALMCLFGEIIRQSDRLRNNTPLNQIQGIVLVDEIEKHLHIRLQKEALPKLLRLFPGVQFIVSSHSPFFSMGLADEDSGQTRIIDLDNGGIISTPTNNEVYQGTYELFLHDQRHFAVEYEKVSERLKQLTRPVVITEGKTDIKHLLKAMEMLGVEQKFDILPEVEQPDGDGTLLGIIENQSKVWQPRKIIALFDRDSKTTKDITDPYKNYGNNVFALRLQCPRSRIDEGRKGISIEYLYSDDEIHTILPNGRQLFFGNEFINDSIRRHKTRGELRLALPKGCGFDTIVENNGGQAVFDNTDTNHLAKKDEFAEAVVNGQVAISQRSWENFRPTIDIINQIIEC